MANNLLISEGKGFSVNFPSSEGKGFSVRPELVEGWTEKSWLITRLLMRPTPEQFAERMQAFTDNLESLFGQSRELEDEIKKQLAGLNYE